MGSEVTLAEALVVAWECWRKAKGVGGLGDGSKIEILETGEKPNKGVQSVFEGDLLKRDGGNHQKWEKRIYEIISGT